MIFKFIILVIFIKILVSYAETQHIYRGKEIKEVLDSGLVDNVRYSLVPREDDSFELMKMNMKKTGPKHGRTVNSKKTIGGLRIKDSANVIYHLYTKKNLNDAQIVEKLSETNFDRNKPTKFIIHGWRNDAKSPVNTILRKAILDNCNCNVFVVDWSIGARNLNYFVCVRFHLPVVARRVAQFIDFLSKAGGMRFEDLTLIGHSLGAQIAGLAGQSVKRGKIGVIIGLDPALPLFYYDDFANRLSADDAAYVQTIHTNAGLLGFGRPVGHGSFYPNWGGPQPGCNDASCSHGRAYEYYGESLYANSSFVSYKCLSYEKIEEKNCTLLDPNIRMGGEPAQEHYPKGIFYVPVNNVAPYSKVSRAIFMHGDERTQIDVPLLPFGPYYHLMKLKELPKFFEQLQIF